MTTYLTTVRMIFDVDHESSEIPDVLNSILTQEMRKYGGKERSLIDWAFADAGTDIVPITLPFDYEPDHTQFPHPAAAPGMLSALHTAAARLAEIVAVNGGESNSEALAEVRAAIVQAGGQVDQSPAAVTAALLAACAPVEVHKISILWGSVPEDGQEAVTYEYPTKAEFDAFVEGVEAAEGWLAYETVEEGFVYHLDKDADGETEEDEA